MTKRVVNIFSILTIALLLSFGCAQITKDTKIKCPKCGAIFTVDEGLAEIQKKGW